MSLASAAPFVGWLSTGGKYTAKVFDALPVSAFKQLSSTIGSYVDTTFDFAKRIRLTVDNSTLGMNFGNIRFGLVPGGAYKPGNRISDNLLLSKDKFAKNVLQITEARRTIGKADLAAERLKFLGQDAVKVGPGKWRSIDGTRQFRVKPNDYLGKHGNIGPHVHLEFLRPNSAGTKLEIWKNIHIPLQ